MTEQDANRLDMNHDSTPTRTGRLFIISGPSGAGKTTLLRAVLDHYGDMLYSVSHTTRKPRPGEKDGVDYHFIPKSEFKEMIRNGQWAEWAEVHDNYYGTAADFLDNGLADGKYILLDIDVQGTVKILKRYPDSVTIFVIPQTPETLRARLVSRGADSDEAIEKRLVASKKEMQQMDIYRHVIVNDHLPATIETLITIIEKYRNRGQTN